MRKSTAAFATAVALGLAMFVPLKASAQGVSIYVGPGYPGYAYYPPNPRYYSYGYPGYGYEYPNYGYVYGYGRLYYDTWGPACENYVPFFRKLRTTSGRSDL